MIEFGLSIFSGIMRLIDPVMAIWVAVIMVLGFWLKRTDNLPRWIPPLPVVLFASFLMVALLFGWLTNTHDGWSGVLYVIAYALGNAIFFTGLSFFIYDNAHNIIKQKHARKNATEDKEGKKVKLSITPEMKRKALVYGVSGLVGFAVSAVVSYFAFTETFLYSLFFGIFGFGVCAVIARTIYHLCIKDNTPRMWGVSIDLLISCAGWLIAVLSTGILLTSVGLAVVALGIVMAYGNRFVGSKVKEVETKDKDVELAEKNLRATLRYKFIDDDPSLGVDSNVPLCSIDGKALTYDEAYAAGKGALAADALEYIKMIETKMEVK